MTGTILLPDKRNQGAFVATTANHLRNQTRARILNQYANIGLNRFRINGLRLQNVATKAMQGKVRTGIF